MAAVGIISQAVLDAQWQIAQGVQTPDQWIAIRNRLYAIYRATTLRRTAYKSNKRARDLIAAQQYICWDLVEVMDEVADQWTAEIAKQAHPYITAAINKLDTTATAEELQLVVGALIAKLNTLYIKHIPQPQLSTDIVEDMKQLIATPDPDDQMD